VRLDYSAYVICANVIGLNTWTSQCPL